METRRVRLAGGEFDVVDRPDGFWQKAQAGDWEPFTVAALQQLEPGDFFVDIGSWIGATALPAAARGARVLAFEPDPVARAEFERNVELSGLGDRITIRPYALARRSETRRITAALELGDSMSSLARVSRSGRDDRSTMVETVDVRSVLDEFAGARIVKVDIEGGEYSLLPAMRRWLHAHKPDLMLSLHTYQLAARIDPLPPGVRRGARYATAVGLRSRIAWLSRIYGRRHAATATGWEAVSATGLLRLMATPGEHELYLAR